MSSDGSSKGTSSKGSSSVANQSPSRGNYVPGAALRRTCTESELQALKFAAGSSTRDEVPEATISQPFATWREAWAAMMGARPDVGESD